MKRFNLLAGESFAPLNLLEVHQIKIVALFLI